MLYSGPGRYHATSRIGGAAGEPAAAGLGTSGRRALAKRGSTADRLCSKLGHALAERTPSRRREGPQGAFFSGSAAQAHRGALPRAPETSPEGRDGVWIL